MSDVVQEIDITLIDEISENIEIPKSLYESIHKHGIIEPLLLKPQNGKYKIVSGKKRYLIAKKMGLKKVPALVKDIDETIEVEIKSKEQYQFSNNDDTPRIKRNTLNEDIVSLKDLAVKKEERDEKKMNNQQIQTTQQPQNVSAPTFGGRFFPSLEDETTNMNMGQPTPMIQSSNLIDLTGAAPINQTVQIYDTINIPWMGINTTGNVITAKKYINEMEAGVLDLASVETSGSIPYTPMTTGQHTIELVAVNAGGEEIENVSASIEIQVNGLGYDITTQVTDSLIMDVNPQGKTNNDIDAKVFGYIDSKGKMQPFRYSKNFDWENGGFQIDKKDNTSAFVIKRGTWIQFDRSLFIANDSTNGETGGTENGKSISMIFKTTNVTDYDAKIAQCYGNNTGIKMYAHEASFKAGNEIKCFYAEDTRTEFGLNIDPNGVSKGDAANGIMKLWLAGTPARSTVYVKGGNKTYFVTGGTSEDEDEDEEVLNPEDYDRFYIGSKECDIWLYRFRMYSDALTDNEMLQNFIADGKNANEIMERYQRNDIYSSKKVLDKGKLMKAAPDLHVITIEANDFPVTKGSKGAVPCKITHQIGNGTDEDQWFSEEATFTLQGTSSLDYVVSAANLDIDLAPKSSSTIQVTKTEKPLDGYAMTKNSIPVTYFNLKANVASSENANNVCAADLFNQHNPLQSKAKFEDSRCRDTIEGHPCAVFFKYVNPGFDDLTEKEQEEEYGLQLQYRKLLPYSKHRGRLKMYRQ